MKKILCIVLAGLGLLAASTAASCAVKDDSHKTEVKKLIKEFDKKKGFESMNLGSFAISLMKAAADDDDDTAQAVKAMDKLKGITLVDMEDCTYAVRAEFRERFTAIMGEDGLLASVKDDGEDVLFYGKTSADGKTVSDLIIYCPDDGELICLWGTISTEGMTELTKSQQD